MIVETEKSTIIRGGNIETKESAMRIKASAKAFKVLSDGLYSDKITAVIREISCNAFDAHVEAGIPTTPFHVTLPNSVEPNFVVRDFGPGITDDNMNNVFTVFFESTKTDASKQSSFDSIGMLGLGCKSPLSYTDSFIVDSFVDGVKNSYSIYKDEEGVPTCAHLSSEESDEPSGLKVTVPVKQQNFNDFMYKAIDVFEHFKVKPKIHGVKVELTEKKYTISSEDFGIRPHDWDGAKAIMGNVCYPIKNFNDDSITEAQRNLLNLSIDLFFDLGELDVAASREALSFDTATINNIKKKIDKVLSSLQKEVEDEIANCDNLWEARLAYNNIHSGSTMNRVLNGLDIEYEGEKLSIWAVEMRDLALEGVDTDEDDYLHNFYIRHLSRPKSKLKNTHTNSIAVASNNYFVLNDDDSKRMSNRIRTFMDKQDERVNIYYVTFNDDAFIEKFQKKVGFEKFIKLSEMPFIIASRGTAGTNTGVSSPTYNPQYAKKIFKYNFGNDYKNSDAWDIADIDPNDEIIYVTIDRFKIHEEKPSVWFTRYFNALREVGIDPKTLTIHGVKESVEPESHWIKFEDHVKDLLAEKLKDNPEYDHYLMTNGPSDVEVWDHLKLTEDFDTLMKKIVDEIEDNDVLTIANFFSEDKKYFHEAYGITHVKLSDDGKKKYDELIEARKAIDTKFPMLSCIEVPSSYSWRNTNTNTFDFVKNRVVEYINGK